MYRKYFLDFWISGKQPKFLANKPQFWQVNQNADKQPNLTKQNNLFKSLALGGRALPHHA